MGGIENIMNNNNFEPEIRARRNISWITENRLSGTVFDKEKISALGLPQKKYILEDKTIVDPEGHIFQYKYLLDPKKGGKSIGIAYFCNHEKNWFFGPVKEEHDNHGHCINCETTLYLKNPPSYLDYQKIEIKRTNNE